MIRVASISPLVLFSSLCMSAQDPPTFQGAAGWSASGRRGAVVAGGAEAVGAGMEVLKAGGNAIDAAVAASFVEGLVNPQMHTIGGECPLLVRLSGESRVIAVNGNMAAPKRSARVVTPTSPTQASSPPACPRRSALWSRRCRSGARCRSRK